MSTSKPWIYRSIKPLLFRLAPETAHEMGMGTLRLIGAVAAAKPRADGRLRQRLLDLTFPAPIGLAAGFDKDARVIGSLGFMGFGFAEVGTVTPLPQAGNPKPRLFRHPRLESLQNAMGFNNAGLEEMRSRLGRSHPAAVPIGVNIGKNKATPDERAEEDYLALVEGLSDRCDYFVVNVSSPNTPGLRDLQQADRLRELTRLLTDATERPVLVKLAPDLAPGEAVGLSQGAVDGGAAGVVLCNTTVDYDLVPGCEHFGGLSGRVLTERSYEMLREVASALGRETLIVSVGGIDSGTEAYRRLKAGASLVEVYTALIYQGPWLARRMADELVELLERDGAASLDEVIGTDL